MSDLTSDQLDQLMSMIDARRDEFAPMTMPKLSRGMLRLIYCALEEWQEEQEDAAQNAIDAAYERGYKHGLEVSVTTAHDKIFTEGWRWGRESIRREQALMARGMEWTTQPAPSGDIQMDAVADRIDDASGISDDDWCGLDEDEEAERRAAEEEQREHIEAVDALIGSDTVAEFLANDRPKDAAGMPSPNVTAAVPAPMAGQADDALWRVTLGPEHVVVTPLRPPIGRDHAQDTPKPRSLADADALQDELSEIVAALQEMADDGPMPSINTYNLDKPAHLPAWQTIINRHDIPSWGKLAEMCGLEMREKRGGMTEARRVQLDRLKDERKANGRGRPNVRPAIGAGTVTESEDGRHTPRGSYIPTEAELIAELKRQAMGGVMPTVTQFDDARPANWATGMAHLLRLGISWNELAALAGLKPNRKGFGESKTEAA